MGGPGWCETQQGLALMKVCAGHDVCCLQECTPEVETLMYNHGFTLQCDPVKSHCGTVCLFVSNELASAVVHAGGGGGPGPSVTVVLRLDQCGVAISTMHLAPFATGADQRYFEMKAITGHVDKLLRKHCAEGATRAALLCGDMNMRKKEERAMERLMAGGAKLRDC